MKIIEDAVADLLPIEVWILDQIMSYEPCEFCGTSGRLELTFHAHTWTTTCPKCHGSGRIADAEFRPKKVTMDGIRRIIIEPDGSILTYKCEVHIAGEGTIRLDDIYESESAALAYLEEDNETE